MTKAKQDGERKEPRPAEEGHERVVHIAIAARRFAGGDPPSPEAYARAAAEWSRLRGAVVYLPTDDLATQSNSPMPVDVDAQAAPGKIRRRHEER